MTCAVNQRRFCNVSLLLPWISCLNLVIIWKGFRSYCWKNQTTRFFQVGRPWFFCHVTWQDAVRSSFQRWQAESNYSTVDISFDNEWSESGRVSATPWAFWVRMCSSCSWSTWVNMEVAPSCFRMIATRVDRATKATVQESCRCTWVGMPKKSLKWKVWWWIWWMP